MIALLTWTNTRGLEYGKIIQNVFTTAKTGALARADPRRPAARLEPRRRSPTTSATCGRRAAPSTIVPGLSAMTAFGLFVAICVSQTGSLFSADAWNNITFTAGEVKDPRRNIPLSLALGTFIVIGLYLLANVAYLVTLPFDQIQHAPGGSGRDGDARTRSFRALGVTIMAIGIMVSTFGCNNGLILAGARAYYAMARDGLFFRAAGRLNAREGAGVGPRAAGRLGGVSRAAAHLRPGDAGATAICYSNLLDYVISAALIFYILTIAGIFRLRQTRPDVERPYRAFGYPVVPALYIAGARDASCSCCSSIGPRRHGRADHRAAGAARLLRLASQAPTYRAIGGRRPSRMTSIALSLTR